MEILVKSRNFGEKWKFWSEIEIFLKSRNFGQKSKSFSVSRFYNSSCDATGWLFRWKQRLDQLGLGGFVFV